ncbi:MAG: PP2C family protein-serine/threonine phosphatase [Bacteroidota bacterium]
MTEAGSATLLAARIESLQEAFNALPATATAQDLARRFVDAVSPGFSGSSVQLLYRRTDATEWHCLAGPDLLDTPPLIAPAPDEHTRASTLDEAGCRLALVHRLADGAHAALLITRQSPVVSFSDVEVAFARAFIQLFDDAHQSIVSRKNEKGLIFSLNHRVLQLNSLIDTGIEVARLGRDSSLYHLALERAASVTNASRGMVLIERQKGETERIHFPATAERLPQEAGKGIAASFEFQGNRYTFFLYGKESRTGDMPFEETDQLLLDALTRQVHASLENRYLHEQTLEKQRIEQELAVAASIQQRILPTALPAIDGYDIAGINIPSKSVGGDYYDCIPLPGGRFAMVIADVAGKGVPAALLVSSLHAYLSVYLESDMPLADLARRLNRVICRASTDDKFITAFIALLTPGTGELESINSGHNPVYVLRAGGRVEQLSVGGIPFGMLDADFPYESERTVLQPGDRVLLYTDGITEAVNEENGLYDAHAPLIDFCVHHRPERADTFIADLIADIRRFTGNATQSDDITALYILRR